MPPRSSRRPRKKPKRTNGEIVHRAVDAMGRIEKSSQKISQITSSSIRSPSDQCSGARRRGVEAARAGAGRRQGLGGRASERRAFAQRSAEAAKEIKILHLGVDITKSNKASSSSIRPARPWKKSWPRWRRSTGSLSKLPTASREQATALAEVNITVGQLDRTPRRTLEMCRGNHPRRDAQPAA